MRDSVLVFWIGGVLGLSGGLGYAYFQAQEYSLERAEAVRMAEQRTDTEAPVFGLYWLAYDCSFIGSKLPAAIRPLACDAKVNAYRSGSFDKVLGKVQGLGSLTPSLVLEERGEREKEIPITWDPKRGK